VLSIRRQSLAQLLLSVFILCGLSASLLVSAQEFPSAPGQVPDARGRQNQSEETARLEREAQKKMNKERQEKLKHDTDELLKLATELKEYVDKTNENILSLNVVKKAEQIEKLAHSVKEKMRDNN